MSGPPIGVYNGFSGSQRARAGRWLAEMWRRGVLPRPTECRVCGQRSGVIDAHAEDYSEPFAAGKTDQWHLCFRCHMILHCRFKAPEAWRIYRSQMVAGLRFEAVGKRNFFLFRAQHLTRNQQAPFTRHPPRPDLLGQITGDEAGALPLAPVEGEPGLRQMDFSL